MTGSHLIAILALAVMAAVWVCVQIAWKKSFPEAFCDPDALGGRMGCGGGCKSKKTTSCQSKRTLEIRDQEEKS